MKPHISLVISCFILLTNSNLLFGQWASTTMPGSPLCEVYSLCVKGSDLFAGTVDGVYRSSDNGSHWQEVNPILPARASGPLVWSLTVNGQYIIAAFYESNVYISSDNGTSWSNAGIQESIGGTPQITAASGNYLLGGNEGFSTYRSTDNGASWTQLGSPYGVRSIAMQDSIALAYGSYGWITGPNGIFRSNDYGLTWNLISACQLNHVHGNPIALSGTRAFAGITSYQGRYVLSSTDAGVTWGDSVSMNCNAINSIVLSPNESGNDFVFAGTDSGVFRSPDGGAHWVAVNNGLTSTLVYSLIFKVQGTGDKIMLFAGTGGGLFYSTDFGFSWSQTPGPSQWVVASDGSVLSAACSNGSYSALGVSVGYGQKFNYDYSTLVYRSTDDGQNWTQMYSDSLDHNAQVTSLEVIRDNSNGRHLFAEGAWSPPPHVQSSSVSFASANDGASWTTIYDDSVMVASVFGTISSGIFLSTVRYAWPNSLVLHSTDEGGTWAVVDTPGAYMKAMCSDGNKIYIGGSNTVYSPLRKTYLAHYIQLSTDNGGSWSSVNSPLDSTKLMKSVTDTLSWIEGLYSAGPHLLVGMRAYNFTYSLWDEYYSYGGGIYHLVQNGSAWNLVDSALMGKSVFGFAASGSTIFAATESGVFRSTDDGTSWNDISSGMNNIYVKSLLVSGSYLFASTSNGLWKRPLSEITSVDRNETPAAIPEKYHLAQNYPNPFNPTTRIVYSVPRSSHVSLTVCNILGQSVATLFDGIRPPGMFTAVLDGSHLASGVYFYKLKADAFVDIKKLVLLK